MHFGRSLAAAGIGVIALAGAGLAPVAADDSLTSLATASVRSPIADENFVFVMTDRYRNGDPSNDRGGASGGLTQTGFDPASISYFHGGDFAGLTGQCNVDDPGDDGLARLKRLGFTAVWVTPPFVNRTVQGDSAAYHGYWFLDLSKPDPHLGTEQQFAEFMACAKKLGMKVFLDVVVNHTADTVSFRGGTYAYVPVEDRPYRTASGNAFNPWRFTSGTRFPALSATKSFPYRPYVQAGFAGAKNPAILNSVTKYHNRGDIDWGSCSGRCEMDGDFYGLDDIFTEDWAVVQALATSYGEWITKYGVDGFRIDTAKHVDPYFFGRWLPLVNATAAAAGKPGFTSFGEVWLDDSAALAEEMLNRGLPSVLDFPFQDTVRTFVSGSGSGASLAALFDADDYFTSASTNAYGLTTFLGNHDMGRIGYFIATDNAALKDSALARDLLAHDLLYLTRGVPVVYYGDEVGMTGSGDGRDKQARQDMFPTKVTEWQTQERIGSAPIGEGSSFDESHPIETRINRLARLRATHPGLATGAQITRYGKGGVFAASRVDGQTRREYVVAFNSGSSPATVSFATATPAALWSDLFGEDSATTDASGVMQLTIPAYGTKVLRANADLPPAPSPSIAMKVTKDLAFGAYRLAASVPGADPASVTFLMRRAGGSWQTIGTDDARPFRAFVSPERVGRNARVQVAAVVTSTSGAKSATTATPLTLKPLY